METTKKSTIHRSNSHAKKAHLSVAASDLLHEGKKLANDLYEEGIHRVNRKMSEAEDSIKLYTDDMLRKVQKNPFTSILIAGGIGFVLSLFLKNKN